MIKGSGRKVNSGSGRKVTSFDISNCRFLKLNFEKFKQETKNKSKSFVLISTHTSWLLVSTAVLENQLTSIDAVTPFNSGTIFQLELTVIFLVCFELSCFRRKSLTIKFILCMLPYFVYVHSFEESSERLCGGGFFIQSIFDFLFKRFVTEFLTIWKKEREKNIIFTSQSKFNVYFYNIHFNLAPQVQQAEPVGLKMLSQVSQVFLLFCVWKRASRRHLNSVFISFLKLLTFILLLLLSVICS